MTVKILLPYQQIGNRLFQLAAVIGLAERNNDSVFYQEWEYEKYFSGPFFNLDFNAPETEEIYKEKHFHYNEITYNKNVSLEGYFQSEKYFKHCSKKIKAMFKVKNVHSNFEIEPNSCFVHVRRGDYTKLQEFHPIQTWDNYYRNAIERMDTLFPCKYYIFSDDIDSVKNEFPENPLFNYVEGNDTITDFYLMTKCRYHIIGNSTYSWWAAYLSEYSDTQTIAPLSRWFGPALHFHNTKDLLPPNWIAM